MKTIYKYMLVALIAFALGAITTSKMFNKQEPIKSVEVDTVYITKIDSTGFELATQQKVETAPVYMTLPKGITLPNGQILTDSVKVKTQKYTGTSELENGTIDFEIYADNLLAYDFKLTTNNKLVTKTITERLPPKSRLYLMGGMDINLVDKNPQSVELGIMYNRRQKWGAGLSLRYNINGLISQEYSTTIGGRVYIGL